MHIPAVPWIVRLLLPGSLTWKLKDRRTIYLTFDDGPVPEVTPMVLDILDKYNAKATFFCVGDNVAKHPDIYQQVLDKGHATGNHTFNHIKGWQTEVPDYIKNVSQCSEHVKSNLFRPPHGRIKHAQVKELAKDYKIIMWSVLTGDYDHSLTKEQVLDYSIKNTKGGSIVVFHDSIKASERMLFALPLFLEHFINKGYRFEKIEL